jgi:hypothetical protein
MGLSIVQLSLHMGFLLYTKHVQYHLFFLLLLFCVHETVAGDNITLNPKTYRV